MRAWTVDADDIRVADDFDESLLHRTPEIDGFLSAERDDKFIVIGTKGFGKTLLLKAKRILYQRDGQATCLPSGSLLDKPIGDKIFGRESIAFFSAAPLPWSRRIASRCLSSHKARITSGALFTSPVATSSISRAKGMTWLRISSPSPGCPPIPAAPSGRSAMPTKE